jgi:hydrogenase-4 component F
MLHFFIAALVVAVFNATIPKRWAAAILTGLYMATLPLLLVYIVQHKGETELNFFTYDSLGILFFGLLCVVFVASFLHSLTYLRSETSRQFGLYQTGLVLLSATIAGAYFSNNAMVSWIFLEATTLAAAILVYHRRNNKALEATWKYVFVCSTGIAIAYLGILFMSIMLRGTAHTDMSYASLAAAMTNANPTYLKLAFLFILIGYSCKMEVFPLYTVGIDANHAAPTPASAFLSTALVNLGFVSIFRIYATLSDSVIFPWIQSVMLITGLLTVFIATIYIQRVKNLKRLLAYSTVENMGIVLIALGLGCSGFYIAVLHVVVHTLIKSAAFLQIGQVGQLYGTYNMFNTGSYLRINPVGAVAIMAALIGLTATPPSGLFLSELLLFRELSIAGKWIIFTLLAAMLCFVVGALYSRLLYICYNVPNPDCKLHLNERRTLPAIIQLVLLAVAFAICFYQPDWLKTLMSEVVNIAAK